MTPALELGYRTRLLYSTVLFRHQSTSGCRYTKIKGTQILSTGADFYLSPSNRKIKANLETAERLQHEALRPDSGPSQENDDFWRDSMGFILKKCVCRSQQAGLQYGRRGNRRLSHQERRGIGQGFTIIGIVVDHRQLCGLTLAMRWVPSLRRRLSLQTHSGISTVVGSLSRSFLSRRIL